MIQLLTPQDLLHHDSAHQRLLQVVLPLVVLEHAVVSFFWDLQVLRLQAVLLQEGYFLWSLGL